MCPGSCPDAIPTHDDAVRRSARALLHEQRGTRGVVVRRVSARRRWARLPDLPAGRRRDNGLRLQQLRENRARATDGAEHNGSLPARLLRTNRSNFWALRSRSAGAQGAVLPPTALPSLIPHHKAKLEPLTTALDRCVRHGLSRALSHGPAFIPCPGLLALRRLTTPLDDAPFVAAHVHPRHVVECDLGNQLHVVGEHD
jgi:hypothetical protein